jgi:ascorbate-specific PTS system EIIC-type component UlaA
MYLTSEFNQKHSAAEAILALKASGLGPSDLAVFSEEPVEFAPGILDRPSRMSFVTVASAATFLILIVTFVRYTQYNYPLVTGGMPLFSPWATGVVFYEITMLGAILSTVFYFLWESGLIRRRERAPVPETRPGVISLRARCSAGQVEAAIETLTRAGAANIERWEESA